MGFLDIFHFSEDQRMINPRQPLESYFIGAIIKHGKVRRLICWSFSQHLSLDGDGCLQIPCGEDDGTNSLQMRHLFALLFVLYEDLPYLGDTSSYIVSRESSLRLGRRRSTDPLSAATTDPKSRPGLPLGTVRSLAELLRRLAGRAPRDERPGTREPRPRGQAAASQEVATGTEDALVPAETQCVVGSDVANQAQVVCAWEAPTGRVRQMPSRIDATAQGYALWRSW
jgi:hypothetical protein